MWAGLPGRRRPVGEYRACAWSGGRPATDRAEPGLRLWAGAGARGPLSRPPELPIVPWRLRCTRGLAGEGRPHGRSRRRHGPRWVSRLPVLGLPGLRPETGDQGGAEWARAKGGLRVGEGFGGRGSGGGALPPAPQLFGRHLAPSGRLST